MLSLPSSASALLRESILKAPGSVIKHLNMTESHL